MGGRFDITVWRGSAFDCSSEEIILLHNRFTSLNGAYGQCNNGSIVGRNLGTDSGRYTSQLNVTATPDIIGKSIECLHENGLDIIIIGLLNITLLGKQSKS